MAPKAWTLNTVPILAPILLVEADSLWNLFYAYQICRLLLTASMFRACWLHLSVWFRMRDPAEEFWVHTGVCTSVMEL